MKIAYLSTFYPYRGGIAQFNELLYKELEKQNEIKAFNFKRQYPDVFFPGKTQFAEEKNANEIIKSERLLDSINPITYSKTAKAISNYQPDILLMKYWLPYLAPSLGSVARFLKKRTKVISILDNIYCHDKGFFDLPLTRFFLSQNHGFIVMNEFVKNELLTLKPNAKVLVKIHPVYNHFSKISDSENAKKLLKVDSTKKTILFFGLIRDYKGLDLLLNAFGILGNEYQLIIAGEPYSNFSKFQHIIDQLPNKRNIHLFNHFIPDEQVPNFFSASDVIVLPYKNITQSGIANLAINYDLPMITTNVGGLNETNRHNKTGLVIEEISSEAIASAIKFYFDNNLRSSFSQEIKKTKKELTWDNFADGITQFYETL